MTKLSANLCLRALPIVLLPLLAIPQINNLNLPISLDADFSDYDGKNSMLTFRGLRLSQGSIGVVADEGRASKLDFEDSIWQLSGNVRIDTGDGYIQCDAADLRFSGHQLQLATITGSPATFELRRPQSKQVTHGEAGRLEYDFSEGVVEFSEEATITEGCNRISGNYLQYNVREQRISARSNGGDDDKVKITYTPAQGGDGAGGNCANQSAAPQEAGDGEGAR